MQRESVASRLEGVRRRAGWKWSFVVAILVFLAACGSTKGPGSQDTATSVVLASPSVSAATPTPEPPSPTTVPSATTAVTPTTAYATPEPILPSSTPSPEPTTEPTSLPTVASPTYTATPPAVPTAAPVASATARPSPRPTATRTPKPAPSPTLQPTPEWQTRSLLAGPGQPGRLYVFQGDQGWFGSLPERSRLLISDDYGQHWTPFPGGLPAGGCVRNVNLDYATPDALYASTCDGLYRWSGSGWGLVSPQQTNMVAIVYGQPQHIWATTLFGGSNAPVIRSDDGGATWVDAASGLVHFNGVANIGIDPRDSNTLYAIIWPKYAGTYLRRGTGSGQWQDMPAPNNNTVINTGMTIDGASGALYVITNYPGNQLWRSRNPNAANLSDIRWERVHDFGQNVMADVLASGWSSQGVALYLSVRTVTPLGGSAIDIGAPVVQRSEDGGQTWTALPIPGN